MDRIDERGEGRGDKKERGKRVGMEKKDGEGERVGKMKGEVKGKGREKEEDKGMKSSWGRVLRSRGGEGGEGEGNVRTDLHPFLS